MPDQQRPKDDAESAIPHQIRLCRVDIPPGRLLGGISDQAEQAKHGADEVAAELGRDGADGQGDQPRPELELPHLCGGPRSNMPAQLVLDGDKGIKERHRPQDTAWQARQQPLEGGRNIVRTGVDVRR
jgi:hypothetical protein